MKSSSGLHACAAWTAPASAAYVPEHSTPPDDVVAPVVAVVAVVPLVAVLAVPPAPPAPAAVAAPPAPPSEVSSTTFPPQPAARQRAPNSTASQRERGGGTSDVMVEPGSKG